MSNDGATFEVHNVFRIPGRSETYVAGTVKSGEIRVGMLARFALRGAPALLATIRSVERIRDSDGRSNLALALDTPEDGTRTSWKDCCRCGDLLSIENVANQSPEPTSTSVTSLAGQEPRQP